MLAGLKVCAADELHQIGVTTLAHRVERDHAIALGQALSVGPGLLARCGSVSSKSMVRDTPAIGWIPARAQLVGELEDAEQVVGVGERHCRIAHLLAQLGDGADGQRAFQERIGGMHLEVHETRFHSQRRGADGLSVFRCANRSVHGRSVAAAALKTRAVRTAVEQASLYRMAAQGDRRRWTRAG